MNNPKVPLRLDSTVIKRQFSDSISTKVVVSGNLVEVYYFEHPIKIGHGKNNNFSKSKVESKRSTEYKGRSIHKARNIIRRLAQANFGKEDKFLTLTLNNSNDFDIKNIKECDVKFRLFIRSIKRKYPNHKYIAVREFQKRGAVHYHLISNLPYIANEELASIWGHGFTKIKGVDNPSGIGAYISKYLSKDFEDPRFRGVKTYIASRNLTRPVIYYGDEAESITKEILRPNEMPTFENTYKDINKKFIYFSEYNLSHPVLTEKQFDEIHNIFEKI